MKEGMEVVKIFYIIVERECEEYNTDFIEIYVNFRSLF